MYFCCANFSYFHRYLYKYSVIIFCITCFLLSKPARAQLSGTYTIDGSKSASSSNYKTFGSAVSDMVSGTRSDGGTANGSGISGNVIFNVADGSYNEQISIGSISGVSKSKTITFQSASADSSKVNVYYALSSSATNNYVIQLNGCAYIVFKQIGITRTGSANYARVIEVKGGAKRNLFLGNSIYGVETTSSYTENTAVIYSGGDNDSLNVFRNNLIKHGSYSFYYKGSSSTSKEFGTTIEGNYIDSAKADVLNLEYHDSIQVIKNTITNCTNPFSNAGIYGSYFGKKSNIRGNKIDMPKGERGIYLYRCKGTSSAPIIIANNFISIGGSTASTGMDMEDGQYQKYFFNTVHMYGTNSGSSGIYVHGTSGTGFGNITIINNNFVNIKGLPVYYSTVTLIDTSDYNNLHSEGLYTGQWGGSKIGSLFSWQSTSKQDANSIREKVEFKSNADLHTKTYFLNGEAKKLWHVKDDIDGDVRDNSKPDIGADEFYLPPNDAGIVAIDSPAAPFCPSNAKSIVVKLKNYGTDTLKSVTVNWSVNGVSQTAFTYNAVLLPNSTSLAFAIGKYIFGTSGTYDLKVYTTNPNGKTDGETSNDTITKILKPTSGLEGAYTIGGTNPDFKTFSEAINALSLYGPCGDVIFKIRDGIYSEQITLTSGIKTHAGARLTITSESGDSTKVILTPQKNQNSVISLLSASYVTIDKITIQDYYGFSASYMIYLSGGSENNFFTNNRFIGRSGTGSTNIIFSYFRNNNNRIIGNYFSNAAYMVRFSSSSAEKTQGIVIKNNVIDSVRNIGIYLNEVVRPVIEGNTVRKYNSQNDFAIEVYEADSGVEITRNKVFTQYFASGIYVRDANANSTKRGLIANNFVTALDGSGIYLLETGNTDVVYNSVYAPSSASFAYGTLGYPSSNKNIKVQNNIFYSKSAIPFVVSDWAFNSKVISTSDNNNIFSQNGLVGRVGTTDYNLSGWETKTGWETNSISVDPRFYSDTNLHINNLQLDGKATPYANVTTDTDGEPRNTTKPDIGADEYTFPNLDAELLYFTSPENYYCRDTLDVKVAVRNSGYSTIDSLTITYKIDNNVNTHQKYFVNAKPLDTVIINIGKIKFSDSLNNITVFSSSPNDSADKGLSSDTIRTFYQGALSGNYTIGKSAGANFISFNTAVADLNRRGVCGPVVFEIEDGVYEGQVFIEGVKGASANNTITFQSKSRDSSKVIMTASAATSVSYNYYTLYLNGGQFFRFKNITIQRTGTEKDGGVIEISRGSHNNIFSNNRLIGIYTNTTPTNRRNIYSNIQKDTNNIFEHNYIKFGTDGIYLQGAASGYENGNIIRNNIFDSIYNVAVFTYYQDALVVENNKVGQTIYSGSDGVLMYNSKGAGRITGNTFYSNQMTNGIYLDGYYATDTGRALVANNFISLDNNNRTSGITLYNCAYIDVLHNSILVNGSNTTSRAFYGHNASATMSKGYNRLYNNIFASTTAAMAIEITGNAISSGLILKSDYNNLFTNGAVLGKWNTTNAANLSAWQTASKYDSNSIFINPKFLSKYDLHIPKAAFLNNIGIGFSSVPIDVDGENRNSTKPDIGADEFTPLSVDAEMVAILSPTQITCGDSFTTITVVISNQGKDSLSNFPVYAYMGGTLDTLLKYTYKDTLGHNQVDTITFGEKLNTYKGGVFPLTVYTAHNNDGDKNNDTVKATFQIPESPEVNFSTGNITICGGEDTSVSVITSSGKTLEWYNSSTATKPFYTGTTYKTSKLYTDQTYYVRAIGIHNFTLGPKTHTEISNTGLYLKSSQGIYFDALHDLIIDSVAVYPDTTGKIIIEVMNSSFQIISTITYNNTKTKTKVFIPMNVKVPAGTNYVIRLNSSSTTGIYRTSGGGSYPYILENTLNLRRNTQSATSQDYYYFFDWHISRLSCPGEKSVFKISVNKTTSGAALKKGSIFNGTYNAGSASNPDIVCTGNTITYELTPPTAYTNSDYGSKWNIKSLSFATAKGTIAKDTSFIKPSSGGNGKLTFTPDASLGDSTMVLNITLSNSLGCDSSFSRYIKVDFKPKADFTFSNVCFGKTMVFTDNSQTSSGTSYKWTFGDGNTSTTANPTHNYASFGTYKVSLELKTSSGCTDTISKMVTVYPFPGVNISVSDICFGDSLRISNSTKISNGTFTEKWYFGDGDSSDKQSPIHYYSKPGKYTLRYYVISDKGCKDSFIKTVNVYEVPQANFGISASETCQNQTIYFSDSSLVGGNYDWDFGDGIGSSAQNPSHKYTKAGIYTVKLTLTGNGGCKDTFSKKVIINSLPKPDFTAPASGCENEILHFTNKSSIANGKMQYKWYFGDSTTSDSLHPAKAFYIAGIYAVKLIVISDEGCKDSMQKTVTIYPKPVANFGFSGDNCFGNSIQFTDSTKISSGSYIRIWSFGDGAISLTANPIYTYKKAGTYEVKLNVESMNGCKDSVIKKVNVYPAPKAIFSASDICGNQDAQFTDQSTVDNDTIVSRLWNFGDGNISTDEHPKHIYALPGKYLVWLKVVTANGCTDSASNTINVYPVLEADFSTTNICKDKSAQFIDVTKSNSANIKSWKWYFGDGDSSAIQHPEHKYFSAGTYMVKLIVETDKGCIDSINKSITIYDVPVASFTAKPVCLGEEVSFTNTSSVSADTIRYTWFFGDNTSSVIENPTHTYSSPGTYQVSLIAQTNNGCADTFAMDVEVYEKPNAAFTKQINGLTVKFLVQDSLQNKYEWDFGDTKTYTQANPEHIYLNDGIYPVKLKVTSSNNCVDEFTDTVIINTVDIKEFVNSTDLRIYPNPFKNQTILNYELNKQAKVRIRLIDITGKVYLLQANRIHAAGQHQFILDSNQINLSKGVYLIMLEYDGISVYKRVVKVE